MALLADLLGRSPTARAALSLLASAPGDALHTREIARRISADPHSTQLALEHLLRAGAVTSRKVANLRLWAAEMRNDRVASVRDLLRREGDVRRILSRGLGRMRGVSTAQIFGSFASGADKPGSDIDVLVIGVVDWDEMARLSEAVKQHVGRDVNFVIWPTVSRRDLNVGQRRLLASILSRPRIVLKGGDDDLGRPQQVERPLRERDHGTGTRRGRRGAAGGSRQNSPRASKTAARRRRA